MSVDEALVGDLLAQSKAAHSSYQMAKRDRRAVDAFGYLVKAAQTRQQAHDADPAHAALAWRDDAIPGDHAEATHEELHAQLTEFYNQQLGR